MRVYDKPCQRVSPSKATQGRTPCPMERHEDQPHRQKCCAAAYRFGITWLCAQAAISQLRFYQDGSSESQCSISTHSPAFDQTLHALARPPKGHRANLYLSPTPKTAPSPQHHNCVPDCKQRRRILPLPRKLQNSGLAKRTKESQPRLARRQVPAPNDQKARKNKSAFNALPDYRVAHFDPLGCGPFHSPHHLPKKTPTVSGRGL